MANVMINTGKMRVLAGSTGEIDFIADTIKIMAVGVGYVANPDNVFIDDGGANDPVDHRTAGTTDQTLGSKVIGVDNAGDFAYFDAADPTWVAVPGGAAIEGLVVYKDTGVATTSPIVCYLDINVTPNGGDITAQFAAPASGGIAKMS